MCGEVEEPMRVLWGVAKLVIGLALLVPISIIVLATTLGLLGALVGIAFLALRIAILGLVVWGVLRVAGALLRGKSRRPELKEIKPLPPVDPYYEAAQRELDRDLGHTTR